MTTTSIIFLYGTAIIMVLCVKMIADTIGEAGSSIKPVSLRSSSDGVLRVEYNYVKILNNSNSSFENIAFPAVPEHHTTADIRFDFNKKFTLNIGGLYLPTAKPTISNLTQVITSYKTELNLELKELVIKFYKKVSDIIFRITCRWGKPIFNN
jgi:hypothetical protein